MIMGYVGWQALTTVQQGKDIVSLTASAGDIPTMKAEITALKNTVNENATDSKLVRQYIEILVLPRLQLDGSRIKKTLDITQK